MQACVLFQLLPDDGDGRVHWNRCEEGFHIIRCSAFPFPKSNAFELVHKVMGITGVMWGMSYLWPKDVGQLITPLIDYCTPAGQFGPNQGVLFVDHG